MNQAIRLPKSINAAAVLRAIEKRKCELSLVEFMKASWDIIEPGQKYVHNWHVDLIAYHLEAITNGVEINGHFYNRLLINVPPGFSKSLIVSVFWPAWEWTRNPHIRSICASHSQDLAIRDSMRMRRLITSEWYQGHWGDKVKLSGDQNAKQKFENTALGFRQAIAAGGITGARGDRVIIDDPHSVDGANSDQTRNSTIQWFREAVPTRVNSPERSAIVVIMQRLHEEDVSGVIIEHGLGYDHICLPMRYDPLRNHPTMLGLSDPRTEEGELLFPERFPESVVAADEAALGPYAAAGQFQQIPSPRGGGIIKDAWWRLWDKSEYPEIDFVMAALDTAYTEKTENDQSAMTVWGTFFASDQAQLANRYNDRYGKPLEFDNSSFSDHPDNAKVIMMHAWGDHLEFHALVEKVASDCRRFKVDVLLIENKASGISIAQELRRLYGHENFSVHLYDPKSLDKVARLYSVQHIFSEGMVFAPNRTWAETVIKQVSSFPRGKRKDLVDTVSMALRRLRDMGMLVRNQERAAETEQSMKQITHDPQPLYMC